MRTIRVGTRKSKLALVQSQLVIGWLEAQSDRFSCSLCRIVTKGDRIHDVALAKVGGKGLFVKEIERALLDGTIDVAVHSMKDMPAELPPGLMIGAVPVRGDPHDVLLSGEKYTWATLPRGASVGTSSLRRAAQMRHLRPDLKIRPLRGNVDTRIARMKAGDFDAIVLAAAGLKRLNIKEPAEALPFQLMLPAVGQGALAIECRSSDSELRTLLQSIHHEETAVTVGAERAFLKRLNGSCRVPIAAYCEREPSGRLTLRGLVAAVNGKKVLETRRLGRDPETLGALAAEDVLARGAGDILAELTLGSDSDAK
ncbi:MAG: hydroxymethylbilane synthase [Sporolactobacillus sp.]|jgi:hydroxymethylbilane synthase|nr:hydroxymethylbilane synthase [Sporolactobacillus sp.]